MYATDAGPAPFSDGPAWIDVDLMVHITSEYPVLNVSIMVFHTDYPMDIIADADLCADVMPLQSDSILRGSVVAQQKKDLRDPAAIDAFVAAAPGNPDLELEAHVKTKYHVKKTGLQYVMLEVCWGDGPAVASETRLEGELAFRNPYGFLPGIYFGYLPFHGARAILFGLFSLGYLLLLIRHWDKLLPLHYAILGVMIIACSEAFAYFTAYLSMNNEGTPYCCPFPTSVVVALVLQMLRMTFSRVLLLVVCLGFGVVRPKLTGASFFSSSRSLSRGVHAAPARPPRPPSLPPSPPPSPPPPQ